MAIQILGSGSFNSDECAWQVDYDSVAQTIGHTVTGQTSHMTITATLTSTGQTFTKDVTKDANTGRVIDISNVPASAIPAPGPRGSAPPVTWTVSWSP